MNTNVKTKVVKDRMVFILCFPLIYLRLMSSFHKFMNQMCQFKIDNKLQILDHNSITILSMHLIILHFILEAQIKLCHLKYSQMSNKSETNRPHPNQNIHQMHNEQVVLTKTPTKAYPDHQEVFELQQVPLFSFDLLKEGEVAVKNLFLSVNASMRVWISGVQTYVDPVLPGDVMKCMGVAEVVFSKDSKLKKGDKVLGFTFWQTYSILKASNLTLLPSNYPNYADYLGVLGISGMAAYFGFKKYGDLKKGETVVVSAAAGAVGEIAVQLAKIAGCTVIGIAGTPEKCAYVKSLGADHVINYRAENLIEKMRQYCPKGFDVYFDNVGGEMLDNLLMLLRDQSRIIACGSISTYNQSQQQKYRLKNYSRIVIKRATIQGYIVTDDTKDFPEAIAQLSKFIREGRLKYRVDMLEGLSSAPGGLKKLLYGKNEGKVMVKVAESTTPYAKL